MGTEQDVSFGELLAAGSALTERVAGDQARAQARERVIDALHAEVERLRIGEQAVLLRPVVVDLQHLRTDLLQQARTLADDLGRQQVVELLESFALSVELALERCGSVPVRPAIGEPFSVRDHRAVGFVAAERVEQDQTVAAVIADGYRDVAADRVVVPAKVRVMRWNIKSGEETTGEIG